MNQPSPMRAFVADAKIRLATLLLCTLVLGAARGDITTSLVGDWAFDDGSGSSIAADSSPFGNTGTLTDFADTSFTSMWVAGRFNSAILFNTNGAISNYVSVPDAASLDFGSPKAFTLAAWVYLSVPGTSQSNGAPIICKGATGLEQYWLGITNGVFACVIRNSSGKSAQIVNSTVSPVAGQWYHVAAIWTTSPQEHYIYINGSYNNSYTGSGFLTSELTTNYPLVIGAREGALNSGFNTPFQGIIDDVHMYSRALSASDIYQLYTNNATASNGPAILTQPRNVTEYLGDTAIFSVGINTSTTLVPVGYQWKFNGATVSGATSSSLTISNAQATNAGTYSVVITNGFGTNASANAILTLNSLPAANTTSGIVGYWKFDDGSGSSTAADSSGNGNNGTLTFFTDTSFTTMWTNGVFAGALAFNTDGTGSNLVAIPSVSSAGPAILDFASSPVFSLSAWIMGPATQTNGAGIIAKGAGNGGEQYILDITNGDYQFYVRDANGTIFSAQTSIAPNGSWQNLACALDAVNGIMTCYVNGQLAAVAVAPFSLLDNSHSLTIGNRQPFGNAYRDAFTGVIDDVRIYNRALTSADAAALYSSKPSPLSVTWASSNYDVVAGATASLAPTVTGGIAPYTYQWQFNGSNIPGATASPLILSNATAAAAGLYDVIVSDSNYVAAATSSVVTVSIEPYLTFNTNGVSWQIQGSSSNGIFIGSNIAQLTPFSSSQSNSTFYDFPLQVRQFQASFSYQVTQVPTSSTGPGEGVVFCIQNDPRGPGALGYNGNGLGVGDVVNGTLDQAVSPSLDLELNINSANVSFTGVSWDIDGALGPVLSTSPLALDNGNAGPGDIISVVITYQGGVATVTLTDTNNGTSFTTATNVDLPGLLGSSLGYVGFTASTGNGFAAQQVSNFIFQSLVNLNIQTAGTNAVITWPIGVGGYVLQETSSLATTNWLTVPQPVSLINGSNHVTIPPANTPLFFRLALPQ